MALLYSKILPASSFYPLIYSYNPRGRSVPDTSTMQRSAFLGIRYNRLFILFCVLYKHYL